MRIHIYTIHDCDSPRLYSFLSDRGTERETVIEHSDSSQKKCRGPGKGKQVLNT